MAKCPHCGEVVSNGQETCFACGQKIRGRVRRAERPHNAAVFVFAGVFVLAAIAGIIAVSSGRARRARAEVNKQEQARITDSARAAVQVKHDSARAAARSDATALMLDEVNKLEQRFELVRQQVVKDQPSPTQAKLIAQINAEMVRLRQLAVTIGDRTGPNGDSLRGQLRDGQRGVRTLLSDLSRASKR